MKEKKSPRLQATAQKITGAIGSVASITVHTLIFIASFAAVSADLISFDRMLLVLTTVVSLEAIYLAIFIQMTINIQQQSLEEVEQDIEEIQEDIDEIQEDVDEIAEDVDEIAEDVDEIAEDVEEMSEDDAAEEAREQAQHKTLEEIRSSLGALMKDLEHLQNKK
jgi:peptidoglycan hydrolase CwlO-like protein